MFHLLPNNMPPMVSRVVAFLVASILLHGFFFHTAAWKAYFFRLNNSRDPPAVKVTILTESLASECKWFLEKHVTEVYESLGSSVIDLQVVPFGDAQYTPASIRNGGKASIECSHGDGECDGNLYEQCVLLELYPYPKRYLPFLQCLYNELPMGRSQQSLDSSVVESCAETAGLDWNLIEACHDDADRVDALQQLAKSLTPYHRTVPWVEINGRHVVITDDDDDSFLFRAVCKAYTSGGGTHPSCSSYSGM